MKCLSLWQPWATMLVRGVKIHETRSWPTRYRGLLAVHASKTFPREWQDWTKLWVTQGWFDYPDFADPSLLPVGAIVGIVTVTDCIPTQLVYGPEDGDDPNVSPDIYMGNFEPGRWAWKCENPIEFDQPIPMRGRQGLFDVPDDMFLQPAETVEVE